jgi:hypothetical protein
MTNLGQNALFLDDNEERGVRFLSAFPAARWVKTAGEAIEHIKTGRYNEVFLDHDLGGEVYVDSGREDCGFEVVRWIEQNKPRIDSIVVHSHNNVAASQMVIALSRAGYNDVHFLPFGRGEWWNKRLR